MGYSTDFNGVLEFKEELTASQLAKVKGFLGEDCREHKDWEDALGLTWVDLEITDDFTGLEWDGSEKTYDLVDKINMIIVNMRKTYPAFGLTGTMLAHGEEFMDVWEIVMENGFAVRKEGTLTGEVIECPSCGCKFTK